MATVPALALLCACSFGMASAAGDTLLVEEFRFGSFQNASRIAVRPSGEIMVADAGQNRIFIFDSPRQEPRSAGGFGWLPGSFDSPTGIASDGVNTYVSDRGNHRIQRLDRRLSPVAALMTRDTTSAEARFGYPAGVALTPFGDLLVLDGENRRLLKFNGATQFDASFGASSAARARLAEPIDVEGTSSGVIVVADRGRLLFLDQFGNELNSSSHAWLHSIRGIGSGPGTVLAVTGDGLLWFTPDGALRQAMPWSGIVFSTAFEPVVDAAMRGDEVYLLTATCIIYCAVHGQ